MKKRWIVASAVTLALGIPLAWAVPASPNQVGGGADVAGCSPWGCITTTPPDIATSTNIQQLEDGIVGDNNAIWEKLKALIMAEGSKSRAANKTYAQALMMHENQMEKAQDEARERIWEEDNTQMPPSMPCAGADCTGQITMAHAVAGGGGVFGDDNSVAGYVPMNSAANENLTSKVGAREPLKTYAVQCTEFASAKEIQEGVCPDPTSKKPNLDILGTTLLGMPKVDHNEANAALYKTALQQLVSNLVQAPPVGKRHRAYYKTLAGQAEEGKLFSQRARISLARTVLSQIAAMDKQKKGFGTDFAKSLNKKLIVPTPLASNASLMQALAWEDQATYGNRKWYQMIAKMSKSALAKERVILQAQQLQYQYIAFRERTNIEAMLATLLAEKTAQIQKQVNGAIVNNLSSGPGKG